MESEPTTRWIQFPTEEMPEYLSWSHFFLIRSFCTKIFRHRFTWYYCLRKFPFVFQSIIIRIMRCNLHWCYTFCTGVTLFALVLHLNCTALSQSESSNFFMYIIKGVIVLVILNRPRASRSSDFEITRAITPWIVLHSVQLLLLIIIIHSLSSTWFLLSGFSFSPGANLEF